jgi:signal transduction histidine kinase
MIPAFLRTLSARVLAGFAVLIVTFGATSVWLVTYLDDLGAEIAVIRTGYLELALSSKDLDSRQDLLMQYLKEELPGEATPSAVARRLARARGSRDALLTRIERTVAGMQGLPRGHLRHVEWSVGKLALIRSLIAALAPDYDAMLAAPAERALRGPPAAEAPEPAVAARQRVVSGENKVNAAISDLASRHRQYAERVARNLERNSDRLRAFALGAGVTAVLIGLLITVWATVNLRPLARLRDGAKRIARGDHTARIPEAGPTEVVELAREFNAMARAIGERQREVVRAERLAAIGRMAAMITHEVRNPLSSIALNTELLRDELEARDGADGQEARALCAAITDEIDRLTAITEEYLAFARLPRPRLVAEPVNPVVDALATFVRDDLAGRGVRLEVTLADDLPPALIDPDQLRQSLLNLVRNAAEAIVGAQPAGVVRLTTRRGVPGQVEVEVEDDGPGIPPEVRERMFDPFVSTKEGGTGLGLALTHQIVRDHGGEIRVGAREPRGARFVVTLPEASAVARPRLLHDDGD